MHGQGSVVRGKLRIQMGYLRIAGYLQPVDFQTQIRPILEKRCQPCHFTGGKMYAKMPFDRPQTIHTLGEKMFTRIKDPKEQAVLRAFLAQGAGKT